METKVGEVVEEKFVRNEDGGDGSGRGNEMETDEENKDESESTEAEVKRMGEFREKRLNEKKVRTVAEFLGGRLNVIDEIKKNVNGKLKEEGKERKVNPGENGNVRKRRISWKFEEGESSGIGNSGVREVEDILKEMARSNNGSPHRGKKR